MRIGNVAREWTDDQLRILSEAAELQISASRVATAPRAWVPIWVVVHDRRVFVRTWYRRSTGWYGHAVAAGEAWIRVSGGPVRVRVTVEGEESVDAVDGAYRAKYGDGASSMVTPEAAASTLCLTPVP